jgi:hypothetical protein
VVAAEERAKIAERMLEERMRQSSAEMEDLVRTEARARARAEAAQRELAAAQRRIRELTQKLLDRDREQELNARAELERKLASLKAAFEDCLAEAASPSSPEALPRKQLEPALDRRSDANREPDTAEVTGAVDAKAKEPSEVEAKWRLVRAADRLTEIQGRLRDMEVRARSAEERAERAEQIARVKAEEAAPLRTIDDGQLRASPSPARVHSERGTSRSN